MQQRRKLLKKIKELTANKVFANPIVTEVKPVTDLKQRIIIKIMWNNPNQPYVKGVSVPDTTSLKNI
jgi:peptide-methionine (S)-S-oxide reductase